MKINQISDLPRHLCFDGSTRPMIVDFYSGVECQSGVIFVGGLATGYGNLHDMVYNLCRNYVWSGKRYVTIPLVQTRYYPAEWSQ